MESDNQQTKNIGQIKSSSNPVTHSLRASFETVTSSKPYKIFITAEDKANVESSGEQLILTSGSL